MTPSRRESPSQILQMIPAGATGRGLALMAAAILLVVSTVRADAQDGSASSWANGYNSRVRLMAGVDSDAPGRPLTAGVEIETKLDWKTYWRNPGDAGVPPSFDWSKSVNVAAATVLYPAPLRLVDKGGIAIGYLGRVTFPVRVTPADPNQPVSLRLAIEYGVCKEICVPAQAELALDVAAGAPAAIPAELRAAVALVPRPRGRELPGDPVVERIGIDLGEKPRLTLDVLVPGGAETADAFLVAEDGGFVPLPTRVPGTEAGRVRFVVDLSKDVELGDLKGKMLYATVTGPGGAAEASFRLK